MARTQRGAILMFSLIALVAMTLAALALVRTVDTATLVSGNLAFRQSATTSADGGVEAAVAALTAIQNANLAKNVYMDATHAFNVSNAAVGYYSNTDPGLNLFSTATWVDGVASAAVVDGTGNTYRYIVQRMCRAANQVLSKTNCLFSGIALDTSGKAVPLPSDICEGPGCPAAGQSPQYRVTVRVTGPRNTTSYVQAVVY
jgi:Tfp pilus assembly protein PilX